MNPWMALADVRSQLMIDEHNKYPEQLFNCSVQFWDGWWCAGGYTFLDLLSTLVAHTG